MKNLPSLFFVIIILLLTTNVNSQKAYQLSYKLEKGQHFELEIKNNQNISMNMQGQTMVLQQQMIMNQQMTVSETDSVNNKDLELTYTSLWFKQNAMGMEVIWDSKNPDTTNPIATQIGQALGKIIGSPIHVIIDQYGNPIKLTKQSDGGKGANLAGFESGMMVVYSDKKVKEGDSWQTKLQPDPASDFIIESTYKLEEVKGKKAVIGFEGKITGTTIMGEKAVINGTVTGSSTIDIQTGWVLTASITQKLEMEMEQQGMKLPMQMSSFIELTSK